MGGGLEGRREEKEGREERNSTTETGLTYIDPGA